MTSRRIGAITSASLLISAVCLLIDAPYSLAVEPVADSLSFDQQVRPLLATKCFPCHGPDSATRQADLRLDDPAVLRPGPEAGSLIVPGRPGQSELIRRIRADDESLRMPPTDAPQQLTAGDIELLVQWVEQGAQYEPHWSLAAPRSPAVPVVKDTAWPENAIDAFVLAKLEQQGLTPALPPDRARLLRRLSLDLTGLPPTPAELDAFESDRSPDAYLRQVDRLLNSPAYGERMALDWMDAARFADSGGYQGDIFRTMWPWRDWLIEAFNRNLPFDQFTIQQIAGDLLPGATRDQRIATGFHRNHRINDEDGIIPEEFRVEYVADRAETTATVWMGLTLACARCHDHKYDPLTQADYFRFYAFFNSIDEQGRGHGNAPPILRLTTPDQQRRIDQWSSQLDSLQTQINQLGDDAEAIVLKTELTQQVQDLEKQQGALLSAVPVTMVLQELPTPRATHVHVRGAYDQAGEAVQPGVPAALPPLPEKATADRLGLARWLVDPANPLVARVIVNRYWQLHFGTGLVATPEDFGTQGQRPSHPELLDWLATWFIQSGWDVKALHRLIVSSATYRQSSAADAESFQRDRDNRLLARGPRFRLPAELLRDQAIAASGLLVTRIGGPSVRPYQPDGLWEELASAHLGYDQSQGADLYRRGMYTFWRRTIPPPSMTTLDAPNREICTVRRPRTNTPIQALVLMNDPAFVEASRALAERVLREAPSDADARIAYAFRLLTSRSPSTEEQRVLREVLADFLNRFADDAEAAEQFIAVGDSIPMKDVPAAELAAYTVVATTILNLDEAITKE